MSGLEREHIGDKPPVSGRIMRGMLLALGAPLAFLVALNARYMLVRPSCEATTGRILLELATLIVLLSAGFVVFRARRLVGGELREADDSADGQTRFVATAGLLLAALSLVAGVALWLPSLFLSPCGRP